MGASLDDANKSLDKAAERIFGNPTGTARSERHCISAIWRSGFQSGKDHRVDVGNGPVANDRRWTSHLSPRSLLVPTVFLHCR